VREHDQSRTITVTSTGSGQTAFTAGDQSNVEQSAGEAQARKPATGDAQAGSPSAANVFVVHGHDDTMRERVARLLEQLGLHPVILREQTDAGRTVIEKFEHHALEAAFAVILLSPDDVVRHRDDTEWPTKPNRARQNVILEMGYFMGRLGRARTAALYVPGTELPSDLHGLLYIAFDEHWPLRLAKELRDAGLAVDLNRL